MEFTFMIAGIITSIVLAFVGIVKTPLLKYKSKKWFKPILTLISLIVMVGASVAGQIYIIEKPLLSLDFAILVTMVFAGVFFGYNGIYEGFKIKDLVKKLFENLKNAKNASPESKFAKAYDKISKKYKIPVQTALTLIQSSSEQNNNPKPIAKTQTKQTQANNISRFIKN